jgi:hypothetical protein
MTSPSDALLPVGSLILGYPHNISGHSSGSSVTRTRLFQAGALCSCCYYRLAGATVRNGE